MVYQWIYFKENYNFPKVSEGSTIFHEKGGPNANFYRNP